MKTFSKLNLSGILPVSLLWKQPRFGTDYYELVDDSAGDTLYASIGWPHWLSDLAIAHSRIGIWHFDRIGWTRRTITVTRPEEPAINSSTGNQPNFVHVASFEVGWMWEGDIVVHSGKVYHWYPTKSLRNAWALSEVISDREEDHRTELTTQGKPTNIERKRKGFRIRKHFKPVRRERLVYEIEFGMRWFKQEAWVTLPPYQAAQHPESIFLLCAGMYLGYCYNQDSAAAIAVCTTAAVT
jgi:hypothetical protein